jgi:hypothetical protein
MFASQDEIRIQIPEEMRGVVEKLAASGFSLGTVSAHELISRSGSSGRADVPERARLLTVTLDGDDALASLVGDLQLSLTPQEVASIGKLILVRLGERRLLVVFSRAVCFAALH